MHMGNCVTLGSYDWCVSFFNLGRFARVRLVSFLSFVLFVNVCLVD